VAAAVAAPALGHGAHEGGAEQELACVVLLAGAVLARTRLVVAVMTRPISGSDSCHRLSPRVRNCSMTITIYRY
jgi:hypothetical protein